MKFVSFRAVAAALGVALLAGCSDGPLASNRTLDVAPTPTILDGARGGQPDFFWLRPTVDNTPAYSGTFDAGALEALAVEVCQLDATDSCSGPVERFTASSVPAASRITLDAVGEFYEMKWLTGRAGVRAGDTYRVTVQRESATQGYIDVQVVQTPGDLESVDRTTYGGVAKGNQFIVRFRLELPVARNYVRVNEVESNQGIPGDWVEFYNTSATPFDLSGYVFRDNDGSRGYVLPAGTTIPGQGFLVLDEAQFGFGLGGGDEARLFEPDGVTLVDSYSWLTHASTTYARCPDGTGAFSTASLVTKGSANDCAPLVVINEVESSGGVPADWVELYNPNAAAISLEGYVLRDDVDASGFVLPAGLSIPANGFLVLDQSQFGIDLQSADAVRLYRPGGTLLVDSLAWTSEPPATYGRCPDGAGAFLPLASATKGGANACVAPTTDVKINEVESSGGSPGDWVELVNIGSSPVDLSGYVFRDNNNASNYVIPSGTVIAAGAFLVLDEAQFGFGLGGADEARLFAPGGATLVDSYAWSAHAVTTYGRCPDGTGAFLTSTTSTKGSANDCSIAVKFNEIESSGGTPGDWAELYNAGPNPVDLSGYIFRDNNSASAFVFPAGTIVAPGAYLVLNEQVNGVGDFTFGLGSADEARLFAPDGVTLIDSYAWTSHAVTTYGRCPSGIGPFTTTGAPTKGTSNDCGALAAVKINEIESSGGTPGDWVEFINTGSTTADLSGYIFRDNGTTGYTIPVGTTIPAGGFLVLDEAQFGFGLGGGDDARLFAPDGTTLLDAYTWTVHASTTYGRCPDGTGSFATTSTPTKGSANACAPAPVYSTWPGASTIDVADIGGGFFGGNMSGLVYESSGTATPGVMWAARNGPGALFRLVWSGSAWVADASPDWASGKLLRYPVGTGDVDAEGIARVGTAIYISAERNNSINSVSRNSILLFDPNAAGSSLTATREWDLTADLPANTANTGLEGITFVPDAFLVARGFRDGATNAPYNPATYANHNGGLFFVGVEASGMIYAYALDHVSGAFTRVATIASGFASVMEVQFDGELGQLWALCDNTCAGRSTVLTIDATAGSPTLGQFIVTQRFERPAGMPDINNEGFAVSAQAECVAGQKPVYWADDSQTGGYSLRRGTVSCTPF